MMPDRLEQLRQKVEADKERLRLQMEAQDNPDGSQKEEVPVDGSSVHQEASSDEGEDLLAFYTQKAAAMAQKPSNEAPAANDQLRDAMEMIKAMKAEIEALKATKATAPEPVDVELDSDFVEEFPDLAKQVKKAAGIAAAQAKRESDELRKMLEEVNSKIVANERQNVVSNHQKVLESQHPDLAEFYAGGKYAGALGAWAMQKPAEIQDAIRNPAGYSPEYVSFVLSQFKAEVLKTASGKPAPKKPASGDVALSVHSKATKIEPVNGPAPLSAKELADIRILAEKYKHDPAKLNELRERINATYGGH
jgi:hypothetical protein